jgi:hypothetical protein
MAKFTIGLVTIAALGLAACADSPGDPEAAGYFPRYEMGIDQDISATHNVGQPVGNNLFSNGADTWQVGGPNRPDYQPFTR